MYSVKGLSYIQLLFFFFFFYQVKSQNPTNLVYSTQQVITADETKRALNSIKFQTGFKYGSGATGNRYTAQISAYPSYVESNYSSPPSSCGLSLNSNNSLVGETDGSFAVNAQGQASYNIPIFVSPGTAGMQPNLSLFYQSGIASGVMGEGFNLSGLSVITRTNKSPYLDGISGEVKLDFTDAFSLNGSRLLLISGNNGDDGSTYNTEVENYSTITSQSFQGMGPERFRMVEKNGTTIEFGGTADSRLTGVGDNTVLAWYVSKIIDEFGNYMLFNYKVLNGETVIDNIQYTGNASAGLAPYGKVSFEYVSKTEKNKFYIAGKEFNSSQLLKSVTCTLENQLVKKYKLNYIFEERTLLNTITEVNADGTELKPTEFCWSNPANNATYANMQSAIYPIGSNLYNQIQRIIPADLNGDGLSDVVSVRTTQVDYIKNNYLSFYNGSAATLPFTTSSTSTLPFPTVPSYPVESSSVFDTDFNNKQEVYFMQSNGSAKQYSISKITETGFTTYGTYSTANTFLSGQTPSKFYFDLNDYTGDGKNETVIIDPEKITVSGLAGTFTYSFGNTITMAKPFDFNGDGVRDFITIKNNTSSIDIAVLKLGSSGFTTLFTQTISFTGNVSTNDLFKHIGLGDFNGDGKMDFLYMDYNKQNLYIKYSNGVTFLSPKQVTIFTALQPGYKYNLSCPDFNSDGFSDIIITDNNQNPSITNYQTYFSVGNTLIKGLTTSGYFNYNSVEALKIYYTKIGYKFVNQTVNYATSYQFQGDFNGDGKVDFMSLDPAAPSIIIGGAINAETRNLVRVNTGLKKQIDISYSNTSTKINHPLEEIYSDGTYSYSDPLVSINPNMFVVDKVKVGNSNTQFQNTIQYYYTGAIFHKYGKGFLGFQAISSFDLHTGLGSTNALIIGASLLPQTTEVSTGKYFSYTSGGKTIFQMSDVIASTRTDFMTNSLASYRFFFAPSGIITTNYLNATSSSTQNTYDLNKQGNISAIAISYGWPGSSAIRTENSNYTYTQLNGRWRLTGNVITKTQTGEPAYARAINYTYDAQNHLSTVVNDPTFGVQSLQTTFSNFNSFGLPTKSVISSGEFASRSSETIYDTKGRFVIQTKNPLLQTESFVYDPLYGNLIKSTDISGLVSEFKYDGVGRLFQSKLPDNTTNTVEYTYDNDGGYPNPTIYKKKVKNEGTPESFTYYDSFGRVIKTQTQDALSNTLVSTNTYDAYGDLTFSTEPHFSSQQEYLATKYTKENVFYRMDKVETVKYTIPAGSSSGSYSSTGIFTQYKYSGKLLPSGSYTKSYVETVDHTRKLVRKEFNMADQIDVVSNGEPNPMIPGQSDITQTATYNFSSNGQPKSIVLTNAQNAGVITHQFAYSQLGYQSQLNDPSAGISNYVYNSIGELKHSDDANGTWDFTYDDLGRVATKTGSQSGTTSYNYVTSGSGLNKIKKVLGPNVVSEFTYDNLHRNTQVKETVGTKTFISEMTYDTYGHLKEYKYPGGFIAKYNYNSTGFLTTIKDASNQLIWQLDNINSAGQLTGYTFGNGIQTTVSYDVLHQLDIIQHGSIHKQDYNFNSLTGNLTSREFFNYDPVHSSRNFEKFTFDGLDRLNKAEQQDPLNMYTPIYANNTSFDVLGNIQHKDDAGDYVYANAAKPFNITQINNPTPNIPTNPLNVVYNDLRKVKKITESTTNKEMNFLYGNDDERIRVDYLVSGVNQYTRYYQANYDTEESVSTGVTKEWNYIFAPNGLAAIYYKQNALPGKLLYVLNDHLGSPILVTDNSQVIQEKYSFDAWGRRRNPDNWTYAGVMSHQYLNRGFTFHEHLDEFNLINMNGRVYDPVLGRFIQPDNYVQAPDNLQNFNRYGYCINNPLRYTDPTGYWFGYDDIAVAAAGFVIGAANYLLSGQGNTDLGMIKAGLIGAGTAWLGYNTFGGSVVVGNYIASMVGNAFVSYVAGGSFGYTSTYGGVDIGFSASVFSANGFSPFVGGNINHNFKIGDDLSIGLGISVGGGIGYSQITHSYNSLFMLAGGIEVGTEEFSLGLNTSSYKSGDGTSQRLGGINLRVGQVNILYQNDWLGNKYGFQYLGDNGDRYRTAALRISYKDYSIGFKLATGNPGRYMADRTFEDINGHAAYNGAHANDYRLGAVYFGYQNYQLGWNSEGIRHVIQNRFAHDFLTNGAAKWFQIMDKQPSIYGNSSLYYKWSNW